MQSGIHDQLAGVHSKMEWARKHFADLDTAVLEFLDSNPYKIKCKYDSNTQKLIYYISEVSTVPIQITHIAGDTIANLISALDCLAYQGFLKGGAKKGGRNIYFPIVNTNKFSAYLKKSRRKVCGIPENIITAINDLQPYQGGRGHDFWVLNELNNLNKHRNLITVGSRFQSMDIGAHIVEMMEKSMGKTFPPMPFFIGPSDSHCPLKAGDHLFVDAPNAKPNPKIQFKFDIALDEEIVETAPLIETLQKFINLVDKTANDFSCHFK